MTWNVFVGVDEKKEGDERDEGASGGVIQMV
jgi:hypothetical protein